VHLFRTLCGPDPSSRYWSRRGSSGTLISSTDSLALFSPSVSTYTPRVLLNNQLQPALSGQCLSRISAYLYAVPPICQSAFRDVGDRASDPDVTNLAFSLPRFSLAMWGPNVVGPLRKGRAANTYSFGVLASYVKVSVP
jgi:hypothetical protein